MIKNKQLAGLVLVGFFTSTAMADTEVLNDDTNIRVVSNCEELQAILLDLSGEYIQTNDIDCKAHGMFTPIGDAAHPFTGSFNGQGYTISNVRIYNPDGEAGLFGYADGVLLKDTHLSDLKIIGGDFATGGLVGSLNNSTAFQNSATGYVHAGTKAGGLVGVSYSSFILHSYAAGSVIGMNQVGGLVGSALLSKIYNSYAVNDVDGSESVGGLVGALADSSEIIATYAAGSVVGESNTGGLVGTNVDHSLVMNSFWDIQATGLGHSNGGIGYDTVTMQSPSTYAEWDNHAWVFETGEYPVFAW